MATDFDVTVTVSRSELSLGSLVLSADTGYYVSRKGIGPGDVSQRRITVDTPFTSGRTLVHAVKDVVTSPVDVRVVGTSVDQLFSKIDQLTAAFSQFRYSVQIDIEGHVETWVCEPADYAVGSSGAYDDLMIRSNMQMVKLSVPHKPL